MLHPLDLVDFYPRHRARAIASAPTTAGTETTITLRFGDDCCGATHTWEPRAIAAHRLPAARAARRVRHKRQRQARQRQRQ